jgi:hypothetical protein
VAAGVAVGAAVVAAVCAPQAHRASTMQAARINASSFFIFSYLAFNDTALLTGHT